MGWLNDLARDIAEAIEEAGTDFGKTVDRTLGFDE